MTEAQKARHAAYMRAWKKRNPGKVNEINQATRSRRRDHYNEMNRRSAAKMAQVEGHPLHHASHPVARWTDPSAYLLSRVKVRAKQKGIVCEIDVSDVQIPEFCPVLGIRLAWGKGQRGWRNMGSPSVDRIKPQLGYVKGNVRVISNRANHLKGNGTIEELKAVLDYMLREGANATLAEQQVADRAEPVAEPAPQLEMGW